MLARILLIAAVLVGLYFLIRHVRRFPTATPRILRTAAVAGVAGLLLLLIARGGAEIAVPLLTVLAPLLIRWLNARPLPSLTRSGSGSSAGNSDQSTVTTRFLRMTLNHETGIMSGVVLTGSWVGKSLSELEMEDVLGLWRECQIDPQSVAVLESYLDRQGPSSWRDTLREAGQTSSGVDHPAGLGLSEAYQMLGLQPGASREEIQAAYRRLIQRLHPDHGGSAYLASCLNRARELLLDGFEGNR